MSVGLGLILENLDNPNVQNLVRNSPDVQKHLEQARNEQLSMLKVLHPAGDPTAGTMVAVDPGLQGDAADSSVLGLLLNFAEPRAAAGAAVFGLALVTLPLIAGIHSLDDGLEVEKVGVRDAAGFTYDRCKRTGENADHEKPLPLPDLEKRFGPLDPVNFASEILMTESEASEKSRCTEDETGRLQQSVINAKAAVRRLRRRSALAYMGLAPSASGDEVQQRYKRMALEMHPDKGGDAECFQQLQEMKERLTKSIQEEEDEEEKKKAEESDEKKNLPPTVLAKQLRREAHNEAVKLWDIAREAEAEMLTDKGMLKGSPGHVLSRFRSFVDQYSNKHVRMLPHGNKDAAKRALWKFKVEGLELIAASALVDASQTANLIATHINYKLVARSGSKEVAADAQALLVAVASLRERVDNFLAQMGREREEAQNAADIAQEEEDSNGGPFRCGDEVILVGQEFEEEEGKRAFVLGSRDSGYNVRLASGRRITVTRQQLLRPPPVDAKEEASGSPSNTMDEREDALRSIPSSEPISVSSELVLPPDPVRDDWDPEFSHPYVGAMDGFGDGIFCRACCRWISTRKFAHEPFLRHVKAAHKVPPLGWKGPLPVECE